MKSTSIDAYHQIKENGLLSRMRFKVYETIHLYGPINISQIIIKCRDSGNVVNTGSFSGRISELQERGVIRPAYEGICPITGHNTIFWETTEDTPREVVPKTKSKREKKAETLKYIKDGLAIIRSKEKFHPVVPFIQKIIERVDDL